MFARLSRRWSNIKCNIWSKTLCLARNHNCCLIQKKLHLNSSQFFVLRRNRLETIKIVDRIESLTRNIPANTKHLYNICPTNVIQMFCVCCDVIKRPHPSQTPWTLLTVYFAKEDIRSNRITTRSDTLYSHKKTAHEDVLNEAIL